MRLIPCGAVASLLAVVALVVAGCGGSPRQQATSIPIAQDAPGYCQQLANLPDGLQTAVSNAAASSASSNDRAVIAKAVAQLRSAAADKTTPTDARAVLEQAARILDKLSKGKPVTDAEAQSFMSLEGTVNTCVHG